MPAKPGLSGDGPVDAWSKFDTVPSQVEVSEQPLDTLPGELQDELLHPSTSGAKPPNAPVSQTDSPTRH